MNCSDFTKKSRPIHFSCGLALALAARPATAQNPNDGFDPNANGPVKAMVVQQDGRIVIGGSFTSVGGVIRSNIARLNVDGSVDAAFNPGADNEINALAIQADGKILVGGSFNTLGGQPRRALGRLSSDGSLDVAFNPGADSAVLSLAVQAGGKILVGGAFTLLSGQTRLGLGRVNSDGSLDVGFDPGAVGIVRSLLVQPDGAILLGGLFDQVGTHARTNIARLSADGSVHPEFTPGTDGPVACLALQVDRKILVGGSFTQLGGQPRSGAGRLNADGSVDPTFNPGPETNVAAISVQADGKIVMGGLFTAMAGQSRTNLARLNPDGSLDSGFQVAADGLVLSLAVESNGKILAAGEFSTLGGTNRNHVGRLYPEGSLDATFNPSVAPNYAYYIYSAALQAGGNVVIGSTPYPYFGEYELTLARVDPAGNWDRSFAGYFHGYVGTMLVQNDGKIVVGGTFRAFAEVQRLYIARVNADGTLDQDFNPGADNDVHCLAMQADGKIVVAGVFNMLGGQPRAGIGRLNSDGSLDNAFDPGWVFHPLCLAVQPDGKILVGGYFGILGGQPRRAIGRLNADGTLDANFNPMAGGGRGHYPTAVYCLALQADGKILVGGDFTSMGAQARTNIVRLNADGSLDMAFSPGTWGYNYNNVAALALQTDGKILLGGEFTSINGQYRSRIGRLNSDGTLDQSFVADMYSASSAADGFAVQADGKILAVGGFAYLGGQSRRSIGRLTSGSTASQTLTIDKRGTTVTWSRGGSSPEVEQVAFEQSIDGANYAALGSATRIAGGWQLTGLSFPEGRNFWVRARGRASSGILNRSSGLIESVARFWHLPPPFLSSVQVLGGGAFQFSFANTNAVSFSVLASTNVALPAAQWDVLGAPVPMGGGVYQFTDPQVTSHAGRFYQLRSP